MPREKRGVKPSGGAQKSAPKVVAKTRLVIKTKVRAGSRDCEDWGCGANHNARKARNEGVLPKKGG